MARISVSRLILISILLYFISLVTPAFSYHMSGDPEILYYPGFFALVNGFLALLIIIATLQLDDIRIFGFLAWLANPLIVIAWVGTSRKARAMATYSSLAALILSFFFLFIRELPTGGPQQLTNITINIGYILWVLSILVARFAADRLEIPDKKSS